MILLPLKIFNNGSVDISFFILDLRNVPNLLASDQLDKLKAKLNYEPKMITLKDSEIPLSVFDSGHLELSFEMTNLNFLVNSKDFTGESTEGHGPGQPGIRLKSGQDSLRLSQEEAEFISKGKMKEFFNFGNS